MNSNTMLFTFAWNGYGASSYHIKIKRVSWKSDVIPLNLNTEWEKEIYNQLQHNFLLKGCMIFNLRIKATTISHKSIDFEINQLLRGFHSSFLS